MTAPQSVAEFNAAFNTDNLNWVRFLGTKRFDYPIDYSVAVLEVDPATGRVDFLSRWEPDSYCHYHRHLGETSLLVLEGEHNVVETRGFETLHKKRSPGFAATNAGGDVHMEFGGAEGALVFFRCYAVDGKLFEVMDRDGTVLNTAFVEDFLAKDA